MRISIQSKIFDSPWGGGNQFALNLKDFLTEQGHYVIDNLFDKNLQVILMTDPLNNSQSTNYNFKEITRYKKHINKNVIIVHRINECDERKHTNFVNAEIVNANSIADSSVFVSKWLKELYEKLGLNNNNIVIKAGSNKKIFNINGREKWNREYPLKIVTHHWGTHPNKGYEVYKYLDELIGKEYLGKVEFTFIGNLPKKTNLLHTKIIEPLFGIELSQELKKNHVYLTASKFEPSGNHHIEGAQCGLPLLYIKSGGVTEYCQGFGVSFSNIFDFKKSLEDLVINYEYFYNQMLKYPNSGIITSNEYLELFFNLINKKNITNKKTNIIDSFFKIIFNANKIKYEIIQ